MQWWYDGRMKIKTSLTLSEDVVAAMDRLAGKRGSRSAFIEQVLRDYLADGMHAVAAINRCSDHLNREMIDVLALKGAH